MVGPMLSQRRSGLPDAWESRMDVRTGKDLYGGFMFSQAWPATLVPSVGFRKILFGLRGRDEFSGHSGRGPCV